MLIQRINRQDPEKLFLIVKAGEDLLQSRPVCFHFDGTNDGLDAFLVNAAVDTAYTVGIADANIDSGEFGLVQCYGFRSDAYTIGDSVGSKDSSPVYKIASSSSGCLALATESLGELTQLPNFIGADSADLATSDAIRLSAVFIRCMG